MTGTEGPPVLHLARPLLLGVLLAAAKLLADTPTEAVPPAPVDSTRQARDEAEAGSRAFAAGDYLEAAESFGRAVALDSSNSGYGVLRARALGELVDRDDASPANMARLRTVVSIYDELLAADPANEEYAQAVSSLLAKAGDAKGRDAWLIRRARDLALPAEIRSNALRASAETALAEAARDNEKGRREAAAALAARARQRLDDAIAISPGSPACHALRLHGLELEVAIARARRDSGRQAELEALLTRARRTAGAVERAQRTAERTDEY
jgi:tetratricopeptide (TPR) repeat protein